MINRVNNEGDSLGGFHLRIAAFDAGCANAAAGQAINREKGCVINRVNNEGDSLGAFHLRIAAFDAVVQMQRRGQDGLSIINKEKAGARKKAGAQCAPYIRCTVHNVHRTYSYRSHYSFL